MTAKNGNSAYPENTVLGEDQLEDFYFLIIDVVGHDNLEEEPGQEEGVLMRLL